MKRTFKSLLMVTVLSMAIFNIACGKKTPSNPTPKDVTYNVTSPFDIVTGLIVQVNGTISTDTGSYSVTHLGNTTCQYTTSGTDAIYSSGSNASVTVNASESNAEIPLVPTEIANKIGIKIGGTNSTFAAKGILKVYIPEDNQKTNGIDDRQTIVRVIGEPKFASMYTVTTDESQADVKVIEMNNPDEIGSYNECPTEAGPRTIGYLGFVDNVEEGTVRRELFELYHGTDNSSDSIVPFKSLSNGPTGQYGSDTWTDFDTALSGFLRNSLKPNATIRNGMITNK